MKPAKKGDSENVAKQELVVQTTICQRPFFKAMEKLRRKIAERMLKSVDFTTLENLMRLLEIPAIEKEIKELVS